MVVSMRTSASALTNIKKKKEEKNTRLEMVTNRWKLGKSKKKKEDEDIEQRIRHQ